MKLFLLILFVFGTLKSFSQNNDTMPKASYLSVQSGILSENDYNSAGIRTFFEYQKDFGKNWQYAISYEHSRHFMDIATDHPNELKTNLSLLSVNCQYKLNLIPNRLFWTAGVGAGAVHINWEDEDKIGASLNASLTLNFRLSKKIYVETAPLTVLFPFNRVYFSPVNVENHQNFYAFTIIPIGVKVKL